VFVLLIDKYARLQINCVEGRKEAKKAIARK
jgi:hypothetical protein